MDNIDLIEGLKKLKWNLKDPDHWTPARRVKGWVLTCLLYHRVVQQKTVDGKKMIQLTEQGRETLTDIISRGV